MWTSLLVGSVAVLAITWIIALTVGSQPVRSILSTLIPVAIVVSCFLFGASLNSFARLFLSGFVLLYAFKGAALLRLSQNDLRAMNRLGLLVFWFAWPGVDPTPFREKPNPAIEDGRRFGLGMARLIIGVVGFLFFAGFLSSLPIEVATWGAVFAILLAAHLGVTEVLTETIRAIGWRVPVLFDAPWNSHSLSNFWSQRWNRPFVEMNKIFFLPWLTRRFGIRVAIFAVFLISGLLHELALSYPARAGWGGPLLYFAIQGTLVLLERKLPFRGRLWVALVVLRPLPILFHGAFRSAVILPFLTWTHVTMQAIGIQTAISILIIVLGLAQFAILAASFQVPTRLRWREELPRLSSLNHKLTWTYGSFIVYTIVAWGALTLFLRDDICRGTRAGLAVSTVIFLFWGLRLATDTFYFKSSDWPKGRFMQIGHVMLNCLFTFIFLGYAAILVRNIAFR